MSVFWHVNLCFWRSWQDCKEKTRGEGAEECFFRQTKNTEEQTNRKKGFWGKGGWWKRRGALLFILLFNRSVVSNSLGPHKLQHFKLPCPLLSPWVCTNSCPLPSNHLTLCRSKERNRKWCLKQTKNRKKKKKSQRKCNWREPKSRMQFSLTRNGLGLVGGRGSRNRTEGTLFSAPGGLVGCSRGGGKPAGGKTELTPALD